MPGPSIHPTAPCTACGYDLAGLKLPGKCPECSAWNTGLVHPPSVPPLSSWMKLAITVWSCAGFLLAFYIKGDRFSFRTTAVFGRFTHRELISSIVFLAVAISLAILCFRRRRHEAGAAIAAGAGLYVFILYWLRYLI